MKSWVSHLSWVRHLSLVLQLLEPLPRLAFPPLPYALWGSLGFSCCSLSTTATSCHPLLAPNPQVPGLQMPLELAGHSWLALPYGSPVPSLPATHASSTRLLFRLQALPPCGLWASHGPPPWGTATPGQRHWHQLGLLLKLLWSLPNTSVPNGKHCYDAEN